MVKLIYVIVGLFSIAPNLAEASSYIKAQQTVSATDGRTCAVYLHARDESKGLPIVVIMAGTGVYSTGDIVDGNPVAQTVIDEKKAVVISIDKPGISYDESATDHFKIDDTIYNKYTQRDLIQCAANAIKWASTTEFSSASSDIYFLGHSEGTQVSIRVYEDLLKNDAMTAGRIKGFFLSGLVMQSWTDIINYQMASDPVEKTKFWNAFQNHDDATLRSMGDLAYAYWADIRATESNESLLKRLALSGPKPFIQVYQGLKDENTIAQPVMDFETWNRDRLKQNEPGWKFMARYYRASHGLNMAAVNDMIFALMAYLTP